MQDTASHRLTPAALQFSVAIFLSAALVFAVQPMLGKMLLPLVGGAPSGWLTALAFFQVVLLAGYYVAHLLARLTPRGQMLGTLGLLVLGWVALPPHVGGETPENVGNVGQVLVLLGWSIGLPYLALCTVSSGLQRLYAAQRDGGSRDPYFLYAASNAGSFIGLLTYPVMVEPLLPLSVQSVWWMWGYGLLLAVIGALVARPVVAEVERRETQRSVIGWGQRGRWLVLAFIPSSLSMGLTALITADLGSVPLFWVVPLGLYLLTFVVAFGAQYRSTRRKLALFQLFCVALQVLMFVQNSGILVPGWIDALLPLTAFVTTALLCHGRLADDRPAAAALTEFYLWLALGGALGGVFNAFIAPLLFPYPVEFIVVLCASVMFVHEARPAAALYRFRWLIAAAIFGVVMARMLVPAVMPTLAVMTLSGFAAFFGLLWLCKYPRQFAVVGVVVALILPASFMAKNRVAIARDFFGVLMVIDRPLPDGGKLRMMAHGSTIQGIQLLNPDPDPTPRMNFAALAPLFAARSFNEIGVIGLGAGMAVCFHHSERHFTVYEIDPLVRDMAKQWFSYIRDCGEPRWRIGDGRIELARDAEVRYDMIMIDAFSSGSIPSHLLTREAFDVYRSRLKPDGIIILNINNRYYDFFAPLAAIAQDMGWQSWKLVVADNDLMHGRADSHWALLAPAVEDMQFLETSGWQRTLPTSFPVWHDDHANILAAMTLFYHAKAN